MPDSPRARAAEIESLLPRLTRLLYRTTEDSILADLPLAQMRIVRILYGGSRTVTSLGEELALTPSAVTQLVNRLEDGGWVTRAEDNEDRRVKRLELTDYAVQLMKNRQQRRVNRLEQILARLTEEQQRSLHCNLLLLMEAGGGEVQKSETMSYVAEVEQAVPLVPPFYK
jgi:DNA-binding MarR family transcriptional regulator